MATNDDDNDRDMAQIEPRQFFDVIEQLSSDQLTIFFLKLGLTYAEIEKGKLNSGSNNIIIQATVVLGFWLEIKGLDATLQAVLEALDECGFRNACHKVAKKWRLKGIRYHRGGRNGICMHLPKNMENVPAVKEEDGSMNLYGNIQYKIMKKHLLTKLTAEDLVNAKYFLKQDPGLQVGIPDRTIEDIETTADLLECLERVRLLDPMNLIFIPILLNLVERNDLKKYVDEYANLTRHNNPLHLYEVTKTPESMYLVEVKIRGDIRHHPSELSNKCDIDLIEEFRTQLAMNLGIEKHNIRFEAVGEGSFIIVFLLPDEVKDKLRSAAIKKAHWLTDASVLGIHIQDDEYISLVGTNKETHTKVNIDDDDEGANDISLPLRNVQDQQKEDKQLASDTEQTQHRMEDPIDERPDEQEVFDDPFNDDQETIHDIEDIFRRIDMIDSVGELRNRLPAIRKTIKKLQDDMKSTAYHLKKRSLASLQHTLISGDKEHLIVAKENARAQLHLAIRLHDKNIELSFRFRLNTGLVVKLLLAIAECALILAYYTSMNTEEEERLYHIATNRTETVRRSQGTNEPAIIMSYLVRFITTTPNPVLRERAMGGLLKRINSHPEQLQKNPVICTVLAILKLEIPSEKWQEYAEPLPQPVEPQASQEKPDKPGSSDSGIGSSRATASLCSDMDGSVSSTSEHPSATEVSRTLSGDSGDMMKQGTKNRKRIAREIHQEPETFAPELYCPYCNAYFNDLEDIQQHCEHLEHRNKIRTMDTERTWKYRQPPSNVGGKYEYCESIMAESEHNRGIKISCTFSNNHPLDNTCPKAHSKEELEEWNGRYREHVAKMADVYDLQLYSRLENLLAEYYLSDCKDSLLTENDPPGVKVHVLDDKVIKVITMSNKENKDLRSVDWEFEIEVPSTKTLQTIGLLLDDDGRYFHLYDEQLKYKHQIFTKKNLDNVVKDEMGTKKYKFKVLFDRHTLGDYRQWIVFDFGENPKLIRKLEVHVVSEDVYDSRTSSRSLPSFEATTFAKSEREFKESTSNVSTTLKEIQETYGTLDKKNYREYMLRMIELEEQSRLRLLKRFQIRTSLKLLQKITASPSTYLYPHQRNCYFGHIELQKAPLDDSMGSQLVLTCTNSISIQYGSHNWSARIYTSKEYEYQIHPDEIYVELNKKWVEEGGLSIGETVEIDIDFVLNRQLFDTMRKAVKRLKDVKWLFPPENPNPDIMNPQEKSKSLDKWQACAARFMQNKGGTDDTTPLLLLYGPFGSGKTHTFATTAMDILEVDREDSKILICTHSNSAADLYVTEYFDKFVKKSDGKIKMHRLYAPSHDRRNIPNECTRYMNLDSNNQLKILPKEIAACQLLITTTSTAFHIPLDKYMFTHILIDEAAQMLETEAVIPLALATPGTCVVMTGDHRQMGPTVYSNTARQMKFHHSLLQRLILYNGINECRRCVMLTRNYRNNKEILDFVSKMFGSKRVPISVGHVRGQPSPPYRYPLEFCVVSGWDKATYASYENEAEVSQVCWRVESLIEEWPALKMEEIGVFSPYMLQVRKIRKQLRKRGLGDVTVERVQNVQGKEYRVVIISTVRGRNTLVRNEDDVESSSTHYLGLLSDFRQIYTSFTRTQSLLIVVGDPVSLCSFGNCRRFWEKFLMHCRAHDSLYPADYSLEETLAQSHSLHSGVKSIRKYDKLSQPLSNSDMSDQLAVAAQLLNETADEGNYDPIHGWFDKAVLKDMESNPGEEEDFFLVPEDDDLEQTPPTRCIFRVNYDRQMYAIRVDNLKVNEMISINTNTQRKTALDGDEVIVDKKGIDDDTGCAYGVVRSIQNRAVNMEKREIVCHPDPYSDGLMVPLDHTLPKINILVKKEEGEERKGKSILLVPIYRLPQYTKDPQKRKQQRPSPVFVKSVQVTNEERPNKLFLVQWFKWNENRTFPLGMVIDELPQGFSGNDTLQILKRAYAIPLEIYETYNPAHILKREICRRDPVHQDIIFTIDPSDTHDFDDAFSIEEISDEKYIVGIHIADVTSFFAKNTTCDRKARDRAMSFYPRDNEPVYMLPRDLIVNLCSLVQGEQRLTLSLFVTFDKNGKVIKVDKIRKTVTECTHNFCYEDVQEVINRGAPSTREEEKILQLHNVAIAHRRQRLGLRQYTDNYIQTANSVTCAHACLIVEELMVIANHEAAKYLTNLKEFRQCTPLRIQPPPILKEFYGWCQANMEMFKYSFYLGSEATWLNCEIPTSDAYDDQNADKEIVPVLKQTWEDLLQARTVDGLANILCCDSKHPKHAAALRQLRQIMRKSEHRVSDESSLGQRVSHAELGLDVYTHYTSPFRLFIDVVVQRLIHAAISDVKPPYSESEIRDICLYCDSRSAKAKEFERRTRLHKFALDVQSFPFKTLSFIESISEDDMMVGYSFHPSILLAQQRNSIEFNCLKPCKPPTFDKDKATVTMTWNERVYSTKPLVQSRKHTRRNEELALSSDQFTVGIPGSKWIEMLKCIRENDLEGLKRTVNQTRKLAAKPQHGPELRCIKERSITFNRRFSQGDVLQVQLQAGLNKGILSSSIGLISISPELEFCIEHRESPVSCFTRLVDEMPDRGDIKAYQDSWIPIVEMETAYQAVQNNDTIIINDIDVMWQNTKEGSFVFSQSVCSPYKIGFSSKTESRVKRWYLCIRCHASSYRGDTYDDVEFTLVTHAFIEEVTLLDNPPGISPLSSSMAEDTQIKPVKRVKVSFRVHKPTPWTRLCTAGRISKCTVEFIKKPSPSCREEEALEHIITAPMLIQDICVGDPFHDTKDELDEVEKQMMEIADKIDFGAKVLGSPFPKPNEKQKEVIKSAITKPFTVVQGPPGTGKSVTGTYMVYFFTEINDVMKQQLLYCGPSNKSVDIVSHYLARFKTKMKQDNVQSHLKFVRVYSEGLEAQRYPYNGMDSKVDKAKLDKIDVELEKYALHDKIRKRNGRNVQNILWFESTFHPTTKRFPTERQIAEYKKAIHEAEKAELQKYNIILCTCNSAWSLRISECSIAEVIVDEAGMCSEPETLIPLVATKPRRVVLIGDHKQLRPIIQEQTAKQLGLDKSLLEQYYEDVNMLNIQYRMHPAICAFPSQQFYHGALETGPRAPNSKYKQVFQSWDVGGDHQPTVFCHIKGKEETVNVETDEGNEKSKYNEPEIRQTVRIAKQLVEKGVEKENIAILTQYRQQCNKISKAIEKEGLEGVVVSTVIISQGGEWDFVILSTVRTLPWYKIEERPTRGWKRANLGCITDENEMNVALTRAREGMIIVGDKFLLQTDKQWRHLIDGHYKKKGCIIDAKHFLS
ncbi:3'-5' exoribonuclease HELZ2-like isoform X2 [Amphiura filiformis]|uniref:3'-5' exoribonuclease HELZ2-like isoform X2 n=1 Tax=Amphiura filiformis TaxID=82378 RepID=UPI003B211CC5